jgi:membrane-associated phospholipid phosphatase
VLWVQKQSSVVGAAFPSSHVAAAWALWLTLRKDFRTALWLLLPVVVLLTVSTFILQYHYVVDAAAGILLALVFEWLMARSEVPVAAPAVRERVQYAWQE